MMILVDIKAPSINDNFNFRVDENAFIADVISEIGEILVTMSSEKDTSIIDEFILCECEKKTVLPLNRTLKQCGVGNGSRLMIV